jgi:hypothetical protein
VGAVVHTSLAILFFGLLAVGCYIVSLSSVRAPGSRLACRVAFAVLLLLGLERMYCFAISAYAMRIHQHEVEFGVRQRVGLWLKDHVQPGEKVYLEPVGYIGYFSEAKMLDWPGLVSVEVDELVKAREIHDLATPAILLKPEWLVLRPFEVEAFEKQDQFLTRYYEREEQISAKDRLKEYDYLPMRDYIYGDAEFSIWHRKKSP